MLFHLKNNRCYPHLDSFGKPPWSCRLFFLYRLGSRLGFGSRWIFWREGRRRQCRHIVKIDLLISISISSGIHGKITGLWDWEGNNVGMKLAITLLESRGFPTRTRVCWKKGCVKYPPRRVSFLGAPGGGCIQATPTTMMPETKRN